MRCLALFFLLAATIQAADSPPRAVRSSAPALEEFQLQDFLGRDWRNEYVSFPLSSAQLTQAKSGLALVDAEERPVAYQVTSNGKDSSLGFLTDLPAFGKQSYRFKAGPEKP